MTDWVSLIRAKVEGEGEVTYRCHTCGELIEDGDVLWAEEPDLTTHHRYHEEPPDGR